MKNLFTIILFLGFTLVRGQDTIQFYDRGEYMNYIFGNLSDSVISTGFLIDRNSELDSTWKKFILENNRSTTAFDFADWFLLYQYLSHAEMDTSNTALPPLEQIVFPLYKNIYTQEPAVNGLRLPIMLFDFEVNKFTEGAVTNGNIVFENSQFSEGSNAEAGVVKHELFCATTFADSIFYTDFWLVFDPDYIFSNTGRVIDFIELMVGTETFILYQDDEINIAPFLNWENKISLVVHFDNSATKIITSFNLDYDVPAKNLTDDFLAETDFFDEVGSIGNNPQLRYGVLFGCGNNGYRKPAIFVAGYGPSIPDNLLGLNLEPYQYLIHNSCVEYFHKFNIDGVLDSLLNTGHDVVIVRFIEPLESVIKGGDRLEELINYINTEKWANGSYIENIITGYSAGGLAVRYTLDKMEHKHLNDGALHHHCKLYISFEGEQAGANVALGAQHALDFAFHESPDPMNAFLFYIQDSEQSRQLSKYFREETGKYFEENGVVSSSSYGQHHDELRSQLIWTLEELYITNKQVEKMGYHGYPAFTRNVCITNGSRSTQFTSFSNGHEYNQNSPFLFVPGHQIVDHSFNNMAWFVNFISNKHLWDSEHTGNGLAIFGYTESNFWGNTALMLRYFTDNTALILDNAPGGFIGGEPDPVNLVFQNFRKFAIDFTLDQFDYKPNCFTPLIFTLDIRNYDPVANNYQMHYDLQENLLMGIGYDLAGNIVQSDFYGYPVLGHPNDHFTITPFEAIYADEYNATHISSLNVFGVSDDVADLFSAGHPTTRAFMLKEMQYYNVYLQNYEVGWNTNVTQGYQATYEAENLIIIGEKVTPSTDVALYEVLANGIVSCYAKNGVHITEGFHVTEGGIFHAYVSVPSYLILSCTNNHAPIINGGQNQMADLIYSNEIETEFTEEVTTDFSIQPNPSEGDVSIIFANADESTLIQVFNLSGQLVYSSTIPTSNQINLLLPTGVYVVNMLSDGVSKNKKLIVQ